MHSIVSRFSTSMGIRKQPVAKWKICGKNLRQEDIDNSSTSLGEEHDRIMG
jgi:hypothetical protein